MNKKQQLEKLQAELVAIKGAAENERRDFTPDEMKTIEAKAAEAMRLKEHIAGAEKSAALLSSLSDGPTVEGGRAFLSLSGPGLKRAASVATAQVLECRGIKNLVPDGASVVGTPLEPASPIEMGRIPTAVTEVLPVTERDHPQWQYLRQVGFDNQAAVVAPGGEKPTTTIELETVTGSLVVIAHLSEGIDKYLLADNDSLRAFVQGQLLYGLGREVEQQVLNGDGQDGNLLGLRNVSGVLSQAPGPDALTTLRLALTKLESLGHEPSLFVLNVHDWAAIETARNASGAFDLGSAVDRAARRAWGIPVVASVDVPEGEALALDAETAASVDVDARGVSVDWDASIGFSSNSVRARVESRFSLSVYRPDAVCVVELPEG